jgi:hypothetical protein
MSTNTHTEGNKIFSYGTHVATIDHEREVVVAHGKWSTTTTTHVNKKARELGYKVEQDPKGQAGAQVVSGNTFAGQRQGIVKEDRNEQEETANILPIMRMFAAIASMDPDEEQAQKQQERILFATPGVIKPENWDKLTLKERQERTRKALQASVEK